VRTVYFETLKSDEQLLIAQNTDLMIGIHGNGLTNSLWMKKGAVLVEIFPNSACIRDYEMIATMGSLRWVGWRQGEVVGPGHKHFCAFNTFSPENDINVEVEKLFNALLVLRRMVRRQVWF
jgi:protein O-GlcNAc transferase